MVNFSEIIEKRYSNNDGNRTLFESIIASEIIQAIKNWIGSTKIPGVLIGGLALSYYVKPRYTMDIDVLYITDNEIPDTIPGFKKIRKHAFQHNETHVEVEVLSAEYLDIPEELVKAIVDDSVVVDGIRIASKSGLVALKLQRGGLQDQADIEQLVKSGGIDLKPYQRWLTDNQIELFKKFNK